ncbi:MAG TPA: flagellar hook protein FlgE [Tepidisphaeraceae bacterium]|jgi:flagellar hook protein FlgE|nr:flagellar hook protein FlgE [Tepidisphaeraceae bacterium]
MSSLTGALFAGLSGLSVNTTQMDVVGNNIANANTTAFKSSRALFAPQFYITDQAGTPPSATSGGTDPSQYGLGATVAGIEQNFTPGTIQSTGVPTDMALDGSGFFVIKSNGMQQYTRNGAFSLNSNNQLVTTSGAYVQGFAADAKGNIIPGNLTDLSIPLGASTVASPTTSVNLEGNLNASGTAAAGASVLTSGDVTNADGTGAPDPTTLLTNIASTDNPTVPLFNVGDTLTLDGVKGGRTLEPETFTVTATSSAQDLLNFYQQGLGIDTTASTNPAIPPPGATLEADAANPGSAIFTIVGNEGNDNALEIPASGFSNQAATSPMTFADGTNQEGFTSAPSGESVNTSFTAYDSLGNPVNVDVTATLESTADTGNTWRFFATSADNKVGGQSLGDGTLTFDSTGQLVGSTGTTINVDRTGTGAQSPLSINLDFSGTTELSGTTSSLVMSNQDGMPPGTLSSYSVGTDGAITGAYSNGLTRSLGQVAVANFTNPQGLDNVGGNIYQTGADSGAAIITSPQSLGTGALRSGSLELSNVDLSTEFTNLIIASTGFSASSRVISTGDQLIQDLLNSNR